MQILDSLFSFSDVILVPFFLLIIFFIATRIKNRYLKIHKEYSFFVKGLIFKILGVSFFCFVYVYYYGGGDTVNYFIGSKALSELFFIDLNRYFDIVINNNLEWNNYVAFDSNTWYPPWYMWKDPKTFSVCRYSSIFSLIGFKSFIVTSFLTACFSYIGIWKIYRLFNELYPGNHKVLAYLILFLPTLIFWGGGIMKDSYVLGSTCWISYNFYKILIVRKKIFINVIFFFFNLVIINTTKSYVLISLLPGMLLWLNSAYLKNINSALAKIAILPILISFLFIIVFLLFNDLSSNMGVYGNVDSAIQQAQIIQDDLLREDQYGSNNYNIGNIDGSLSGIISVAPIAVFTALFRPLFWEIGSPTMVLSAIENTFLLLFTINLLVRVNPFKLLRILFREPFLLYCFIFSLFFAFGVGIAGTNFGALVRYKTPLIPFFFSMIYILYKQNKITKS